MIKSFTSLLYFDITSISGKSVGRTQKCYFRYCSYPDQLIFKKMKLFFIKIFFSSSISTSDSYVQQIDRAMTTFYNICNFNILGIVQFKFNSPIVLLHILSESTCLNRLISIEYKNKWNILITSNLSCTSDQCTFSPILKNQLSQ